MNDIKLTKNEVLRILKLYEPYKNYMENTLLSSIFDILEEEIIKDNEVELYFIEEKYNYIEFNFYESDTGEKIYIIMDKNYFSNYREIIDDVRTNILGEQKLFN